MTQEVRLLFCELSGVQDDRRDVILPVRALSLLPLRDWRTPEMMLLLLESMALALRDSVPWNQGLLPDLFDSLCLIFMAS
mmetsp:Transcript_74430/g.129045  ORF Transcript_74430/g.129045 Transcript_74430/m.129045 type:complete len:80 (-) Transcript_74430:871-1110(-)